MQKTTNYNLNQWEAGDAIRRADFNADNAAIDAALSQAAQRPYVVGTYTGNGGTQTIELGFKPSCILITCTVGEKNTSDMQSALHSRFGISTPEWHAESLAFTDTGFQVTLLSYAYFPRLNDINFTYLYIAFR